MPLSDLASHWYQGLTFPDLMAKLTFCYWLKLLFFSLSLQEPSKSEAHKKMHGVYTWSSSDEKDPRALIPWGARLLMGTWNFVVHLAETRQTTFIRWLAKARSTKVLNMASPKANHMWGGEIKHKAIRLPPKTFRASSRTYPTNTNIKRVG